MLSQSTLQHYLNLLEAKSYFLERDNSMMSYLLGMAIIEIEQEMNRKLDISVK